MNDKDPAVPDLTNNKIKKNLIVANTAAALIKIMKIGIVQMNAIFSKVERFFICSFFIKNINVFRDH
jgi:hypothetical protein